MKRRRSASQPDQLPRIGAPATRALAGIGITRLSQLTEHRAADLLNLHGMSPRAIGILRQALADQGLSLRDES
jgi:predicted flap endonuclease-1-like 5' DNA nuclease